jgi:hypothetical protein
MMAMSNDQRYVRSVKGLLRVRDSGMTIHDIKRWRHVEDLAGRPSGLRDFYVQHGLCPDCRGEGVNMIGWSAPASAEEQEAAEELKVRELPLYDVCNRCKGNGKSQDG